MAPILGKRFAPDHDSLWNPSPKKQRITSISSQTTPETPAADDEAEVTESALFNQEPEQLLRRSVALALEHVGFDGATPEALESFCAHVYTYATEFLTGVTRSMANARRSQPTPMDFQYALARFDIPLLSLEPHLKPPIPTSKLQPQFEHPPLAKKPNEKSLVRLLGDELSGAPDKNNRPWIPKKFPSFPSKHTYKWTEVVPTRETDPRKIREEAAKTARQGEEALRRLVKVGKASKEKGVKRAASKDPRSKERHELWERTMQDLMSGNHSTTNGKTIKEEDRSMMVNSEQQYFRKPVAGKRKPQPPPAP
ncbi:bromodomain associated protein [Phlyctema vagabunda]|uniref:Transcription initiation factor TFIID subunit 8 n=1 Tax=Phlyctema vagabunda TaxID=108571 RepID=A0ABR4PR33_9HELO